MCGFAEWFECIRGIWYNTLTDSSGFPTRRKNSRRPAGGELIRRMIAFENLPASFQNPETRQAYESLKKQRFHLVAKRFFDIVVSFLILLALSLVFLVLAIAIRLDSPGPVFYRQVRVGRYGKEFRIFKFRTMVQNADHIGLSITTGGDSRITRVGHVIRKCRLDEISQLLNVLCGDMSLVGPRPEVPRYVKEYRPAYFATLLVRPGVTAQSSIAFKDEDKILASGGDPETIYVEKILPPKSELNLQYLRHITVWGDIRIMGRTVAAVLKG